MKYYRDWWIAFSLWWGFLVLVLTAYVKTEWTMAAENQVFFSQIFALVGSFLLGCLAWWLIVLRIDKNFELTPSKEEREIRKKHEEITRQFKLIEEEENLLQRRQQLSARRDAYVQKLERESGLR